VTNLLVTCRFVSILDQLDARVEKLRKDALNLQEKKDYLLMSMDLIKSNEMMQNMSEGEKCIFLVIPYNSKCYNARDITILKLRNL